MCEGLWESFREPGAEHDNELHRKVALAEVNFHNHAFLTCKWVEGVMES